MILLNEFHRQWEVVGKAALAAVSRVGESGWLVLGGEVARFEQSLAPWFGKKIGVGFGNCLDATEHSIRALKLKAGDKILTTPLSAFATTLAIVRAGCVPVFVDTTTDGQLDLDRVEECLEEGEGGIRAILPVHLFGHCLSMTRLQGIRERFGVVMIEDCAQAIGAKWQGMPVGSVGDISVTSFYPTKNLGAMGDGGAAVTDDPLVAETLRALRDYGQLDKYQHDFLGANSRLDELQAAILNDATLPLLESLTKRRRAIASAYREGIKNPAIRIIYPPVQATVVDHLFPVFVEAHKRERFCSHMKKAGIQTGIHYPGLIPDQKAMSGTPFQIWGTLTNSQSLVKTEVSLPIHPYLKDREVRRVIDTCNSWH